MKKSTLERLLSQCEIIFISPFSNDSLDGGGWASRKIFGSMKFLQSYVRSYNVIIKILCAAFSWLINPFLHPIFARYTPLLTILSAPRSHTLILNHSQTFASVLFHKNSILICHDLQFHRSSSCWVRWSEKTLLHRAAKIVVLSDRDAEVLYNQYRIAKEKIINVFCDLVDDIGPYSVQPHKPLRRFVFVGSLGRAENRDAVIWFINNVAKKVKGVTLSIIGKNNSKVNLKFPNIYLIDYVEDLEVAMKDYDACIAPMFSPAGVKIKVIDYLRFRKIVIGTQHSFSGFPQLPKFYVSDNPSDWIDIINNPKKFTYAHIE